MGHGVPSNPNSKGDLKLTSVPEGGSAIPISSRGLNLSPPLRPALPPDTVGTPMSFLENMAGHRNWSGLIKQSTN